MTGHYFDPAPASSSRRRLVRLPAPEDDMELVTDRGVFSPAGLDRGTAVLLAHLGSVPEGQLVDLGCGYGPLALTLARRRPRSTVWAVEINERARQLTDLNARANGLDNVRVCHPEEVPADLEVAGLWSNPPVRIGKTALHLLLQTWLDRLEHRAAARLVVHKHLGSDSLARWLAEGGAAVERLVSVGGYRVLEVRPGATAGRD